jgi:hypothetical protein
MEYKKKSFNTYKCDKSYILSWAKKIKALIY